MYLYVRGRCGVVQQIHGGTVGEWIARSAHCSVWNVVGGQRYCGGLGGGELVLDGRTVPVDRSDAGTAAACRRRPQDHRLDERRTAVWHRRLASSRVRMLNARFTLGDRDALCYKSLEGEDLQLKRYTRRCHKGAYQNRGLG